MKNFFSSIFSNNNSNLNNYLIVGLGNYGNNFSNTRHNIGFKVLDNFTKKAKIKFKKKRYVELSEKIFYDKRIILIKPTSYINLSGKSVLYWKKKEKISLKNILIISDDYNLPLGKIRFKPKGSSGGHNGLKDISNKLQTNEYARLRIGIGCPGKNVEPSSFVLGNFKKNEKVSIKNLLPKINDSVLSFVNEGIEFAMNKFN